MNKRIRKKHRDKKRRKVERHLRSVEKKIKDNWDTLRHEAIDKSNMSALAQAIMPALTNEYPPFKLVIKKEV